MEAEHRAHIMRNLPRLLTDTQVRPSLIALSRTPVEFLSYADECELDAIPDRLQKARRFYDIMTTRRKSFVPLKNALELDGQTGVAKCLELVGTSTNEIIFFKVSNPVDLLFGRNNDLETLRALYERNVGQFCNITFVSGLGGMGKTQLVLKCADSYLKLPNQTTNVAWINADCEENFYKSFNELARKLGVLSPHDTTTNIRPFHDIIKELRMTIMKSKYTFIFDNMDDRGWFDPMFYLLEAWNDVEPTPKFLITTRLADWDSHFGEKCSLALDHINENDAKCWIQTCIQNASETGLKEMVEYFGGYPLALQQAIAIILSEQSRDPNYSVERYLIEAKTGSSRTLDRGIHNQLNNYKLTTATSLSVSKRHLLTYPRGNEAYGLLQQCAYIHPNIKLTIFRKTETEGQDDPVSLLRKLSLFKPVDICGSVTLHRVLSEEVRNHLKKVEPTVLEKLVNRLNTEWRDEVLHATEAWIYASNYSMIVKKYYGESSYGLANWSPLHLLCHAGKYNAVLALINHMKAVFRKEVVRNFINSADKYGRSPLFLAAAEGDSRIVFTLVNNMADITQKSGLPFESLERLKYFQTGESGFTPMHIAVYNNRENLVRALNTSENRLKYIQDNMQNSSVTLATLMGYDNIVRMIDPDSLSHKFVLDTMHNGGSESELQQISSMITNQIPVVFTERITGSSLYVLQACIWTNCSPAILSLVKTASEVGAVVDRIFYEWSLIRAAVNNSVETVRWLFEANENIMREICIENGCSSLYAACAYGSKDVLKFLLIDICEKYQISWSMQPDINNETLLHCAAFKGYDEILSFLTSVTDLSMTDTNIWGMSPIFMASLKGNYDYADKELTPGFSYNTNEFIGSLNMTPLHVAVAQNSVDHTNYLFQLYDKYDSLKLTNISLGNKTLSLLHIAAFFNCPEMAVLLVSKSQNNSQNGRSNIRLDAKYNVREFLETFCKFDRSIHRVTKRFDIILRIMNIFYWFDWSVTALDVAELMGNEDCSMLLNECGRTQANFFVQLIKMMVFEKLKLFQAGLKAFSLSHSTPNCPKMSLSTEICYSVCNKHQPRVHSYGLEKLQSVVHDVRYYFVAVCIMLFAFSLQWASD